MGEKSLVEGQITDAIELVKHLDTYNIKPVFVAWYYYEDADEWRLLLASYELDKYMPRDEALAYKEISEAITSTNIQSLSISHIKILKTSNALVKSLSFLIGTPKDSIIRANFSNTTINGVFIKEMVILRSALNEP